MEEEQRPLMERRTWKRSKKGNLWRTYAGLTLSIFRVRGGWAWCVADRRGPRYGRVVFSTLRQALHGLAAELVRRGLLRPQRKKMTRKVDVEGVGKGAGRVEEATRRGRKTRQPARRRPEKNLRYI